MTSGEQFEHIVARAFERKYQTTAGGYSSFRAELERAAAKAAADFVTKNITIQKA